MSETAAGTLEAASSAKEKEGSPEMQVSAFPLFVVSVLGLFLELMLIRWIGTEVRIFAYLQNTVLVVCFLGLGLGCFSCRQTVSVRRLLVPLFILLGMLAVPATRQGLGLVSEMLGASGGFLIWHTTRTEDLLHRVVFLITGLVITYFLMFLILQMFVPIGRQLGRLMDDHPRTIWAYSVNVAGSLTGVLLFVLLSVIDQPPFTWLAVLAVLLALFLHQLGRWRLQYILVIAAIPALGWLAGRQPGALEIHWSPYQKLVLSELPPNSRTAGRYLVTVNNTGYQAMIDLRPEVVAADPQRFPPEMNGCSQYDIPALVHPNPQRMLVVGAGTGNDVAGGLRQDVDHVTAVEIDPLIIELGRRLHPERPYSSPRVRVITDDARSFFATCQERFDVISFGLLDSHTQTAMTNSRLDHYVYTLESIAHAKSLLADGGVMVLSFEAQKPFIADRMAGLLSTAFGQAPIGFIIPPSQYGWGGVVFIAGDLQAVRAQISGNPQLAALVQRWAPALPGTTPLTSDDWPYIYLSAPRIPMLFYLLAGLMAVLLLHAQRRLTSGRLISSWGRGQWHFFFLGAAFLLLEVQNISKATVVLGSTWWVNAVIISGVLIMILLANAVAAWLPGLPLGPVYFALCASCLGLYLVDISRFAFLPYPVKATMVGALTTLPMLFSGIVFIRSFAAVESKGDALGANLIGSLVGGLLQTMTFVTGIKFLLLVVAALYGLAFVKRPRATLPDSQTVALEDQVHG